jgi:regulator of RNase E activity RraB
MKDEQTIQALADAGSDMSKPHLLEHHFVCETREAAEAVIAWGTASGYRGSPVTEGTFEGHEYVYFDLIKSTLPVIDDVLSETTAMLDVAARSGAEYDGWGCEVVD